MQIAAESEGTEWRATPIDGSLERNEKMREIVAVRMARGGGRTGLAIEVADTWTFPIFVSDSTQIYGITETLQHSVLAIFLAKQRKY